MKHRARKRLAWTALALSLISLMVLAWTQRDRFMPVAVGNRAPAYSAPDLSGQQVSLASLRGKVVVLNVWATWCRPCRAEMPALERLHQQLKSEGLEVVAVSVDAPIGTLTAPGRQGGDVRAFVDEFDLNFTVLHDRKGSIEELFLVQGLPTTFVIDREGRIAQKVIGAREWDALHFLAYFQQLLRS
ncbi:MAG TPA: TlpA disulfide reductase family protein [Longimicrobiales bacterium]